LWYGEALKVSDGDMSVKYENDIYARCTKGMTPPKPFFASTPCLNTKYLDLVRRGHIRYIRGHTSSVRQDSVMINQIEWDSKTMKCQDARASSETEKSTEIVSIHADIVIMATGFARPGVAFVDDQVWRGSAMLGGDGERKKDFHPPNMYLVTFPPGHAKMAFLNDTFVNAIATAGHIHIGILTRMVSYFYARGKYRGPSLSGICVDTHAHAGPLHQAFGT
jgi:hypothetical protein